MSRPRILVAEDDRHIRQGLVDALESEGYAVDAAADGDQAKALLKANPPYDLALLDVMMPGADGYALCQSIRQHDARIGIIFVTAKGQEIDKVLGLKLGADDYVAKPFGISELLARVEAALRRSRQSTIAPDAQAALPEQLTLGSLRVDRSAYELAGAETSCPLTARELKLLEAFCARPAKVLTRNHLLDVVWGVEYYGTTRTLDQHIAQLRKKFATLGASPDLIETVHGVGYRYRG